MLLKIKHSTQKMQKVNRKYSDVYTLIQINQYNTDRKNLEKKMLIKKMPDARYRMLVAKSREQIITLKSGTEGKHVTTCDYKTFTIEIIDGDIKEKE